MRMNEGRRRERRGGRGRRGEYIKEGIIQGKREKRGNNIKTTERKYGMDGEKERGVI